MKTELWCFFSGFIAGTLKYWVQSRYGSRIDAASYRLRDWLLKRSR